MAALCLRIEPAGQQYLSWFNQTGFWLKLLVKLLHHIDAILKCLANRNSEWSVTRMKEGVR